LRAITTVWRDVRALEADIDRLAPAAKGLDGRRIRKAIFAAAASDIETAKDPNELSREQIEGAFAHAIATSKEIEQ
jgi:hypothetical protein